MFIPLYKASDENRRMVVEGGDGDGGWKVCDSGWKSVLFSWVCKSVVGIYHGMMLSRPSSFFKDLLVCMVCYMESA